MRFSFVWEDDEMAKLSYFLCDCGIETKIDKLLIEDKESDPVTEGVITAGTIVECPACHKRYKAKWMGMLLEVVDDT